MVICANPATRPLTALDQEQEPKAPGSEAGSRRGLREGALAMSDNRIMIYGPKPDGTYVVEFRMADGEALAISVPAGETRVLKYFQERMPYGGLFVPHVP
jgi:hypothetical protein